MNSTIEYLGESYRVSVGATSDRADCIDVVVNPTDDEWLAAAQSGEVAECFNASLSDAQLSSAVARIISRDYLVKKKILAGGRYCVQVSSKDLGGISSAPVVNKADLASISYDVGLLVRPLFLRRPDTEKLYPYQKTGVKWIMEDSGRLLADDMGLGKTVQAIIAARLLFWEGLIDRCLILCPKSLVMNWQTEFRKWAPELLSRTFRPSKAHASSVWQGARNNVHVAITNYEQIRDAPDELRDGQWDLVVADEAHRLRNEGAQTSAGIRSLSRKRFWALTGTPIERASQDLASIMSILAPTKFAPSDANTAGSALIAKAEPYILRRKKEAVLPELPKVIEKVEYLELSKQQEMSYRDAQRGINTDGDRIDGALAEINEMRKICDYDPKTGKSSKIDRIIELIARIQEANEKAIVFSYLLDPLRLLKANLDSQGIANMLYDGELSHEERNDVLQKFKQDQSIVAFLASSRVASEGLTITEANHAIFINQWWNPSANNQARDRINRIGQEKTVYCYIFICINTVEEYLEDILKNKSKIFDEFIGSLALGKEEVSAQHKKLLQEMRNSL